MQYACKIQKEITHFINLDFLCQYHKNKQYELCLKKTKSKKNCLLFFEEKLRFMTGQPVLQEDYEAKSRFEPEKWCSSQQGGC